VKTAGCEVHPAGLAGRGRRWRLTGARAALSLDTHRRAGLGHGAWRAQPCHCLYFQAPRRMVARSAQLRYLPWLLVAPRLPRARWTAALPGNPRGPAGSLGNVGGAEAAYGGQRMSSAGVCRRQMAWLKQAARERFRWPKRCFRRSDGAPPAGFEPAHTAPECISVRAFYLRNANIRRVWGAHGGGGQRLWSSAEQPGGRNIVRAVSDAERWVDGDGKRSGRWGVAGR
jgi:hypothetical protein